MAVKTIEEADRKARNIVHGWCAAATAVSWVPGSTLVLGMADMKMVNDVAKVYRVQSFSIEGVTAAIGGAVAGRGTSEAALVWFPVVGWGIKALIAGGVTKAVGEIVISYMRERSPLVAK
ncbi:hypothetical protein GCM10010497_09580 [Streptomyces cinereoruber]|uniref:DUF697 domain-containing protein n=1 Tax=Streptomyces cinereoruber TaxID=67260 RepID=A0AAV4KEQ3_9ACTN|nr:MULTISPECIES: hypothetical protein [Streptomyces]MBB4156855.1 uncharacterized protein (DUF697 family) [Streptomyces cinereoruber]MBY8815322.1 YcjF family protein [Streptomyces cinereoruber]NIH60047.1 uncharacterized protein (DUF697 family) [Streptomyces cinereoruber]GGR09641.1 hypothetical protein GCM10010497_09580 [Streptomyces cinereoruber]